ncbi:MAG: alpha/beta hydrolase [Kiritimatiellia bacterium]|nr:alpha/beta hydrolase [Kiritimatiellia bacterium]
MKRIRKESRWLGGFWKQELRILGKTATIVSPNRARPGRPWVWKGEFLDAFPSVEVALLHKGFHIVHVAVPDQFGSPTALRVWDALYVRLTKEYGFAQRAALIGLSRGGLYVYAWAAAHPDRVTCIYGDAPVCDLASWPGGKGRGSGSPEDWRKLLAVFGFVSDAEALAAQISPVDRLAPLAAADLPLLHVYGETDDVVPWEENTGRLSEKYRALGGSIQWIAKPGCGHHPHGLEDPTPIVEFICRHTPPLSAKRL